MYSSSEQEFKKKYSKDSLALLNFIKDRHSIINGSKNYLDMKKKNPSVERIKNTLALNKKKVVMSHRSHLRANIKNGIEI